MDVRQACVHFLRKSDKKRAITIANGAKFENTRIYVESCGCESSFSGVNGSKPAGNISKLPKNHKYRSNEPAALEITATVFRADENTEHEDTVTRNRNIEKEKPCSKYEASAQFSGSRRTCANPARTKCESTTNVTLKIHGAKVSNLHYTTTDEEVKEHFQSRKLKVAEVAVHTRNAHGTIACVHFHNEKDRMLAIRKTNGSLLYGRKIIVQACCCRRTLREKGYGGPSSRKASSGSMNAVAKGLSSRGKFNPASASASDSSSIRDTRSGLRVKAGSSKSRSGIPLPNSEAPTLSLTPPSTVEAVKAVASTLSSISVSSVSDSQTRYSNSGCIVDIVRPKNNTAPTEKIDRIRGTSKTFQSPKTV